MESQRGRSRLEQLIEFEHVAVGITNEKRTPPWADLFRSLGDGDVLRFEPFHHCVYVIDQERGMRVARKLDYFIQQHVLAARARHPWLPSVSGQKCNACTM